MPKPGEADDESQAANRIDFDASVPRRIADLPDHREWYAETEPGAACLRPLPVLFAVASAYHIRAHHAEREAWIAEIPDAIRRTVESPEIVYRQLEWKHEMGHWTQACAKRGEGGKGDFLVVVLSAARLEGCEADAHQIVTIYPARASSLFTSDRAGRQVLKKRWKWAGKQETG